MESALILTAFMNLVQVTSNYLNIYFELIIVVSELEVLKIFERRYRSGEALSYLYLVHKTLNLICNNGSSVT